MVQFKILAGPQAGTDLPLVRFPAVIGRAPSADVRLEEAGVWDQHLTIERDAAEGFFATLNPEALASINGRPFQRQHLRNGDFIDLGAARLQFWISSAPQVNLRWREILLWVGLLGLVVLQVSLLWQLSP